MPDVPTNPPALIRTPPPSERPSITRGFEVPIDEDSGEKFKFYVIAGAYDDGRIAEIFIHTDRKNDQFSSLLGGTLDALAMTISIGLQHGVPLEAYLAKLRHGQFGPRGETGDEVFPLCTSVFDLTAQWLAVTFPDGTLKR